MGGSPDIGALAHELETLLGDKLGLHKGAFPARVRRAGRRLPRWVRREAVVFGEALTLAAHPKLRRRIDETRVKAAHERICQHLRTIDPADRRRARVLGVMGALAFNLLFFVVLAIGFLRWRGLI